MRRHALGNTSGRLSAPVSIDPELFDQAAQQLLVDLILIGGWIRRLLCVRRNGQARAQEEETENFVHGLRKECFHISSARPSHRSAQAPAMTLF